MVTQKRLYNLLCLALLGGLVWVLAGPFLTDLIRKDDTIYSSGYSESNFQRLTVGMDMVAVTNIMGTPVRIIWDANGRNKQLVELQGQNSVTSYPDLSPSSSATVTGIIYYFTRPGTRSDDWNVRAVTFSTNGIVSNIHSSFYSN